MDFVHYFSTATQLVSQHCLSSDPVFSVVTELRHILRLYSKTQGSSPSLSASLINHFKTMTLLLIPEELFLFVR